MSEPTDAEKISRYEAALHAIASYDSGLHADFSNAAKQAKIARDALAKKQESWKS